MSTDETAGRVRLERRGGPGVDRYEVVRGETVLGTVQRSQLSAGQFGTSWQATAAGGRRRANFGSRDAAARWLLAEAATDAADASEAGA